MVLLNTCFANRYPINCADLRGLVSVTDKDHSGQFISFLEHSPLARLGMDVGLVHFVPETWLADPSRRECNVPLNETIVLGNNAKNVHIVIYPVKDMLQVDSQKKLCARSGDARENSRCQWCINCFTQHSTLVTTCSHCERLAEIPLKSRTSFAKLNEKYHPYAGSIGVDLLDLANNPKVDLLIRRKLLQEISVLYLGLHRKHISDRPDNVVPADHELLHLVVSVQNAGDEGMLKKWRPTIVDRFLTDRLEDFEYVIRASRISAGFEEDSIHNPPPCPFPSNSATEFRNQQESAGASRTSRSPEFTEFAANLGAGWNNF